MKVSCPYCKKEFFIREAKQRSMPENKYYWSVVVEIVAEELGYTKDEMHEVFKAMFLSDVKHIKMNNGTVREIRFSRSTTSLKTFEFEQYLDNIRIWAGCELGINIPLPNEGASNETDKKESAKTSLGRKDL